MMLIVPAMLSARDADAVKESGINPASLEAITANLNKIETDIAFLRERHADLNDLPDRLLALRKKTDDLKSITDEKEIISATQIVSLTVEKLEMELSTKTALVKRMELLYIMMFVFGVAFIIGMVAYSVYMYSKRRR
jgi:signal transduction protein with GAF and PtsI domain